MFREMRKIGMQLEKEEAEEMLLNSTHGTLALSGDSHYPYAVPINHVYYKGKIIFHSSVNGHKIDSLKRNNKVSFCVVSQDSIVPEKLTTMYKSVIAFGRAKILEDGDEKRKCIEAVLNKYAPNNLEAGMEYIENDWSNFVIVVIDIDYMTAKAGD